MVLLNTLNATSAATLSDTSSFTGSYSTYLIQFINIIPITNSQSAEFQVQSGGVFQTSSYAGQNLPIGATVYAPTTFIPLSSSSEVANSGGGLSATMYFYNPSQTSSPKFATGNWAGWNGSGTNGGVFYGQWTGGNGAVTGFQMLFAAGGISTGTIKIYGIP